MDLCIVTKTDAGQECEWHFNVTKNKAREEWNAACLRHGLEGSFIEHQPSFYYGYGASIGVIRPKDKVKSSKSFSVGLVSARSVDSIGDMLHHLGVSYSMSASMTDTGVIDTLWVVHP